MNNLEVIIGIEIHIELNTQTKMFSSAPNVFGQKENTLVDKIDLGYPGTLPAVNKEAVIKGIKLGKALNMKIDKLLRFDRKHYFYADLPKGYQITQNDYPIGSNGFIPIKINSISKNIQIERIQLEEDTAKSFHTEEGTLLNYNRAGVPLIEIVTDPVIRSAEEATEYVKSIKNLALALNISEAKMEEGSMRADINISLRPYGSNVLGTKVEIKNINSLSNIKSAIQNEIVEQTQQILLGQKISQSTKRFDEETRTNKIMRIKKEALDYRFIPEPNINPISLTNNFIDSIHINELPWEREKRYISYGIDHSYIEKLLSDYDHANYFDLIKSDDKVNLAKVFFSEIVSLANLKNMKVSALDIDPTQIELAIKLVKDGSISGKHLKTIIPLLSESSKNVVDIINDENMKQISEESQINILIDEVINSNISFINNNIDRKERVIKYIVGNVMKISKGQANPVVTSNLVEKKIKKYV
ncbi:Asp-tRNA(Asn)/Glu-tRNA(Gln) amidotransferase subunit GatB [Candidatus Mycoplasma mahonii]|uniref:Asp-tRNA(Asn)/Glu-tRNA(Gln) amidotransferase subunit GatB n=1 Tax=Candidatus Mycoplasma mahonii TaxID=3004105 RepID=UPI0026EFFF86|nr:Asp-tRNA(Asn)/Glu-tRNA(Gln) amidotransferase subunit GatB [Candidatus Mycoplasma mahonii]WKX02526.1 Asp-tRNA(Asn)/Glu-tRNA(Gln) amidotransferase subunit GatB [Candidatus Mycoplasma mahonii]